MVSAVKRDGEVQEVNQLVNMQGVCKCEKRPQRVSFPTLDIVKLVMAFLVVEIHTKPLGVFGSEQLNALASGIDCVAVPFFFIASAFLCFRGLESSAFASKDSRESRRALVTTKKLLFLYLVWFAIFTPLNLFGHAMVGDGVLHSLAYEGRGLLLVGEGMYSWPLWYLLASVVAFALVYVMLRGGVAPKAILLVSFAILLLGFGIQGLHEWEAAPAVIAIPLKAYYALFANVRNGLFEGFFYVALGMWLGMNWRKAVSFHPAASVCLGLAGIAGTVVVSPDAHLPFCVMYALGVFLLSIRVHGEQLPAHPVARNASTIVYLVHMLFVVALALGLFGITGRYSTSIEMPRMELYVLTLACSFAVCAIVIPLSHKHPAVKKLFGI